MLGVRSGGPMRVAEAAVEPPERPRPGGVDAAERDAWTVLTAIDRLGPVAFSALLAHYGTGQAILAAAAGPGAVERLMATPDQPSPDRQRRRPVPVAVATAIVEATQAGPALLERVRSLGLQVVTMEEPLYPTRLLHVAMPPHVLFVQGDPAALHHARATAVVGTRRATTHGRTTAGRIARALVAAEAAVVSGLAYGIDGAAHAATIDAGGTTVAVIGGGHAIGIPDGHRRLARAILDGGGAVVSELAPDVQPTHGTFPRRNRIISGLADATVVVEAPARSGALLTATWALEQGRGCFLVPGLLGAPAAAGCLSFLREFQHEARVVAGIPQLIADLGYGHPLRPGRDAPADGLSGAAVQDLGAAASQVAAALVAGMATVDELVATTDLPVATVLATMAVLEDRGLAIGLHGRYRPRGALLGEQVTPRPR
jgi:DNA processing protein